MANTIPLSSLIGFLLHKSYHELTVLSELLPKKSDVERKIELVEYARGTRLLFIRLLALVKWASSAGGLSKCDEVSEALDQRSLLYVDTADQLMGLARNTLLNASLPNFSLAGAIDVLTLGKYPRLPTCIRDNIVPLPPLALEENLKVCRQLEHVIQQRLASSHLPQQFLKNMKIANGQVTFTVPYEFEVCLTVLGDDLSLPWRLLKLVILVGGRQTGTGDSTIYPQQKDYLHKLLQSRLFTDQSPLMDLYDTLHSFCMALKLDLLHIQVQLFSSQVAGDHVRVEEYFPGKLLRVVYWRPDPSQHYSANYTAEQSSMMGRITIAIGGSSCNLSFTLDHAPILPECGAREASEVLDVWLMIDQCVKMRSKLLLQELSGLFKNTLLERYVTLSEDPLSLQIQLLSNNQYHLYLSVDKRMGRLIANVLPLTTNSAVQDKLDEIDRELSGNRSNLLNQILSLQLTVAMAVVIDTVVDFGLSYSTHLPILKPLPLKLSHVIYIHLPDIPNVYLVIGVSHKDGCYGIDYVHHLLETMHVPSVPLPHLGGVGEPNVFLATRSLIQLDEHSLLSNISRTIPVSISRMLLKRKFDQSNLRLPSSKRLCLIAKADISVGVCVRLSACQAATTHMIRQLTRAGIVHHMIHHEAHMSTVVHVIQLPFTPGCDWESYQLLSNRLQSCEIRWCDGKWIVKLLLLQDIITSVHKSSSVVMCRYLYNFSEDVGERLCQDWTSLLKLLGPVLELAKYQQEGSVAVEGWTITEFDYHKLNISHRSSEKLTIMAERGRLHLQLADDNPFNMVHSSLELMLNRSLCLPQLLQGMQSTLQPIILLHGLHNEVKQHTQQYITIQSRSPSMIVLVFLNMYSIELYLNANSTVTIADGGSTTVDPAGIHGRTTPLWYVQSFLQRYLQDQGGDENTSLNISPVTAAGAVTSSQSTGRSSTSTGAVLAPSPYPIASPRPSPIVTLSSPSPPPLPSLPPLPSPHSSSLVSEKRAASNNKGSWSRVLSWEQFQSLLSYNEGDGQCPLSRFLGNFYLLNQFNMQVKQDKIQSGLSREGQIQLRSVDRGVYVFHTDTLDLHIAMDSGNFQKLKFTVQPAQEHVWSDNELETLCNYFHSQVSCPPYSGHAVTAFVRLLSVPLRVLKSCVHLMQLQMSPPADSYWSVRLCLTVPHSIDAPDIAIPGNPAVAFRGKLLIFLEFRGTRSYPGLELVIPILHDPMAKTNSTHLAKLQHAPNTSQLKISIMQAMDGVLRNTAQEYHYTPQLQQESSSLFPCIRAIVKNPLTVVND